MRPVAFVCGFLVVSIALTAAPAQAAPKGEPKTKGGQAFASSCVSAASNAKDKRLRDADPDATAAVCACMAASVEKEVGSDQASVAAALMGASASGGDPMAALGKNADPLALMGAIATVVPAIEAAEKRCG